MINSSPNLFRQGLPAGVRLAFFASLSVILMLVDGKLKTLDTFRQAVDAAVIHPAEAATGEAAQLIRFAGQFFTTVRTLQAENEALRRKNAELSFSLVEFEGLKRENQQLRLISNARQQLQSSVAIGIIRGETADAFSRHVEITLGSKDQIEPGMPVLDENGVIGQIVRVRAAISEVVLLSDPAVQFPVLLPRAGIRCATTSTGTDHSVELLYVPATADVAENDEVLTSGIDRVFPPGLKVGHVSKVERSSGDAFARIWVTLSAAPSIGRYVMVAKVNPAPAPEAKQEGRSK